MNFRKAMSMSAEDSRSYPGAFRGCRAGNGAASREKGRRHQSPVKTQAKLRFSRLHNPLFLESDVPSMPLRFPLGQARLRPNARLGALQTRVVQMLTGYPTAKSGISKADLTVEP